MLRGWSMLALAISATAWSSNLAAAPFIFTGQGVIARSFGPLSPSGSAVPGDSVRFSFTFDLDAATQAFTSPNLLGFSVPSTAFSGTIGDYTFVPADPTATLAIGRGFTNFGGTSSEPSRQFSFTFRGVPGAGAPFIGAFTERFTISATFRDPDGPSVPITLADVTDPATGDRRTFDYFGAAGGPPPLFGFLQGDYNGGFAAAAIPEPAIWAMLILGFGAIGASLRRRGAARPVLSRVLP